MVIKYSNDKREITYSNPKKDHHTFKMLRGTLHLPMPRGELHIQTTERVIGIKLSKVMISLLNGLTSSFRYTILIFKLGFDNINKKLEQYHPANASSMQQHHLTNQDSTISTYNWINIIQAMDHQCSNTILTMKQHHSINEFSSSTILHYRESHHCVTSS